jgi:hypothetical protein
MYCRATWCAEKRRDDVSTKSSDSFCSRERAVGRMPEIVEHGITGFIVDRYRDGRCNSADKSQPYGVSMTGFMEVVLRSLSKYVGTFFAVVFAIVTSGASPRC